LSEREKSVLRSDTVRNTPVWVPGHASYILRIAESTRFSVPSGRRASASSRQTTRTALRSIRRRATFSRIRSFATPDQGGIWPKRARKIWL